MSRLPHPIPYQGSKRRLADAILSVVPGRSFGVLYEPFAGSAAITLASASRSIADRFVIGDSLAPLAALWTSIVEDPSGTADAYAEVWRGQLGAEGAPAHFNRIRAEFNEDADHVKLLYLLARCVKNAPRFSGKTGDFNQSPDHRRTGMRPEKMRREITGASELLRDRTIALSADAEDCVRDASMNDLVYMDPPWQGTTEGVDKRYHQGFARSRLEELLADLNRRDVPWILSYDGRSGERTYGEPLDSELWGAHLELQAGRSSQSTLAGRNEHTVESLYVSPNLAADAQDAPGKPEQTELLAVQ